MLSELLGKINTNFETYGLSSDFAEVTDRETLYGLIEVKMLQRAGAYAEVLYIGFQKPSAGTQGVVLFVGKQKYPVFIPLNQSTAQKSGTLKMSTQKKSLVEGTGEFVQFDQKYVFWDYRSGSPPEEQFGLQEVEDRVKEIAKVWYYDSLNTTRKKLVLGDVNASGHRSHKNGVDVDIYVDRANTHIVSVYSTNQIKRLLNIFSEYGVRVVYFNPIPVTPFLEYSGIVDFNWNSRQPNAHKDHFHLRF